MSNFLTKAELQIGAWLKKGEDVASSAIQNRPHDALADNCDDLNARVIETTNKYFAAPTVDTGTTSGPTSTIQLLQEEVWVGALEHSELDFSTDPRMFIELLDEHFEELIDHTDPENPIWIYAIEVTKSSAAILDSSCSSVDVTNPKTVIHVSDTLVVNALRSMILRMDDIDVDPTNANPNNFRKVESNTVDTITISPALENDPNIGDDFRVFDSVQGGAQAVGYEDGFWTGQPHIQLNHAIPNDIDYIIRYGIRTEFQDLSPDVLIIQKISGAVTDQTLVGIIENMKGELYTSPIDSNKDMVSLNDRLGVETYVDDDRNADGAFHEVASNTLKNGDLLIRESDSPYSPRDWTGSPTTTEDWDGIWLNTSGVPLSVTSPYFLIPENEKVTVSFWGKGFTSNFTTESITASVSFYSDAEGVTLISSIILKDQDGGDDLIITSASPDGPVRYWGTATSPATTQSARVFLNQTVGNCNSNVGFGKFEVFVGGPFNRPGNQYDSWGSLKGMWEFINTNSFDTNIIRNSSGQLMGTIVNYPFWYPTDGDKIAKSGSRNFGAYPIYYKSTTVVGVGFTFIYPNNMIGAAFAEDVGEILIIEANSNVSLSVEIGVYVDGHEEDIQVTVGLQKYSDIYALTPDGAPFCTVTKSGTTNTDEGFARLTATAESLTGGYYRVFRRIDNVGVSLVQVFANIAKIKVNDGLIPSAYSSEADTVSPDQTTIVANQFGTISVDSNVIAGDGLTSDGGTPDRVCINLDSDSKLELVGASPDKTLRLAKLALAKYNGANTVPHHTGLDLGKGHIFNAFTKVFDDPDSDRVSVQGAELVTNGTFDSDLSGWTYNDTYWSWDAGVASKDADGGSPEANFSQSLSILANSYYTVKFTVAGTAPNLTVSLGGTDVGGIISSTGTYQYTVKATNTDPLIFKPQLAISRFTLDDISVIKTWQFTATRTAAYRISAYVDAVLDVDGVPGKYGLHLAYAINGIWDTMFGNLCNNFPYFDDDSWISSSGCTVVKLTAGDIVDFHILNRTPLSIDVYGHVCIEELPNECS